MLGIDVKLYHRIMTNKWLKSGSFLALRMARCRESTGAVFGAVCFLMAFLVQQCFAILVPLFQAPMRRLLHDTEALQYGKHVF